MLLPACGHTLCQSCVASLPRRGTTCPLCRTAFSKGTEVPNWSLRQAAEGAPAASSARPEAQADAAQLVAAPLIVQPVPAAPAMQRQRSMPSLSALSALGIPPGLARLAVDEAHRVGLRLFLLDNSGSTNTPDGHELNEEGTRLLSCTRWQEICASARAACKLGAATGVPCEFHLLNPLRARSNTVEGDDFIRTHDATDVPRLEAFLRRCSPGGVTPLAEALHSLRPRLDAFASSEGASGRAAFLIIVTDGEPTPSHSGRPTDHAVRS